MPRQQQYEYVYMAEDWGVLQGCEREIFKVVSQGTSPAQWAEWLRLPLEQAVATGNADLATKLTVAGAGGSAVLMAVRRGREQLVRDLLARGAPACATEGGGDEPSPLHVAAQLGHNGMVHALLLHGADRTAPDSEGRTPLHLAARGGHLSVVDLLLAAGTGVDYVNLRCYRDRDRNDRRGETALDLAAGRGHADVLKSLLGHGAAINAWDAAGLTALHRVAVAGGKECCGDGPRSIDVLVDHEADLDARNGEGRTPLHFAAEKGRSDTLMALLEHGADENALDGRGQAPIHVATDFGHVAIAIALLASGADVNRRWGSAKESALEMAARKGRVEVLREMIAYGADVNASDSTGYTPLHAAATDNEPGAIDALVEAGANVEALEKESRTPLHHASQWDAPEAIIALLRHGADKNKVDISGLSPLHIAVVNGSCSASEALLAAGADTKAIAPCNEHSMSLIEVAACQGHVGVLKAVIRHGADVNAVGGLGGTPLMLASASDNADAVDVLVKLGASVNAVQEPTGKTCLHLAANGSCCETVRALLQHGADVNATDALGNSPLHYAAKLAGKVEASEMVDILLRHGADETTFDNIGRTAYQVIGIALRALERRQEEVVRVRTLLTNAPADRKWRRRGFLVMCRALSRKVRPAPTSRRAKLVRPNKAGSAPTSLPRIAGLHDEREETAEGKRNAAADLSGLAVRVLALEGEDVFRAIVSFL